MWTDKLTGLTYGKGTRFPVKRYRAWGVGDEVREQPLLLNPLFDEPMEHLKFDSSTGSLIGISERGTTTVDLLGLNTLERAARRRKAYHEAYDSFRLFVGELPNIGKGGHPEKYAEQIEDIRRGAVEFAMARRRGMADALAPIKPWIPYIQAWSA